MGTSKRSIGRVVRILAGVACVVFAAPPASHAAPGDPYAVWVVGTGEKNGKPVTVRWRDAAVDPSVKAAHALCAVVTWHFRKDASGRVPAEESERTWDFQITLEQQLEKDGLGIEAVSLTDEDKREWTYYVSDRAEAVAALDSIRREDPAAPISYEIHPDREWQALQETLGAVKE